MENNSSGKTRAFALLGFLLGFILLLIVWFLYLKNFMLRPTFDEQTEEILSEQGIDSSSHGSFMKGTEQRIQDLNQQVLDRAEKIGNIE